MTERTPGFAEREYNLRQAFPDHALWFARWARESAAAREALDSRLDVRYGPAPKQTVDVFLADGDGTVLLFIHGGYWRSLDKSDHSFVATRFVDAGIGVAVINYDLCPAVTIAEIVEQCRQAVAWLVREGASHGLPCRRVVVAGHSAGGHLAAMLIATDWSAYGLSQDVIAGGIAISGVFDLEPLVDVSFNVDLRLDVASARALSPANLSPRSRSPLLLLTGALETREFIRQAWLQWERWPQCRPPGASGPMFIADRHHFSIVSELADATSEMTRAAIALTTSIQAVARR